MFARLKKLGDVTVVAPLEEKSTTGHSLTIHKPLRMIQMAPHVWGVSGSPADCVYLSMKELFKAKPDLVISGINRGANLGQDVYYSGTVSAAREAAIMGIPSIAVSLAINFRQPPSESEAHYDSAARILLGVLKKVQKAAIPKHTLLNLNVPDLPFTKVKGVRLARQGFRYYSGTILKRKDHRGRDYFWLGGHYKGFHDDQGTDCAVVASGFAWITPLKLDATDLYCPGLWPKRRRDVEVQITAFCGIFASQCGLRLAWRKIPERGLISSFKDEIWATRGAAACARGGGARRQP